MRLAHSTPAPGGLLTRFVCAEQTLQHFGVREHWPPLSELSAAAGLRCVGAGWGARILVDTPSIISPEFWIGEVRDAVTLFSRMRDARSAV